MRPRIVYEAAPTAWRFHQCDDFVRGLIGAVGSGKSVACCWELWRRAHQQKPGPDGLRRSRWAVIRNTYRELQDTTIKTWRDWFDWDKGVGAWRAGDMTHVIEAGDLHIEVMFRALDRPDDIKKLLSLELTGAWINEAREVPKQVLDMLQSRVGRYPSKRDGGPTWFGVIMDTNPPSQNHWWYRLFETARPQDFAIFHQPSGLSPEAENLANLPPGYYDRLQQGHDESWVNVYCHGEYGYDFDMAGTFYGQSMDRARKEGRVTRVPWVPSKPVMTFHDLGLDDAHAIWYLQKDGARYNWIRYEEFTDVPLLEIAEHLKGQPYHYGAHYGPHDLTHRESINALRRLDVLHDAGITMDVVPNVPIVEGINATRIMIAQSWFDIDECSKGITALASYRRKVNEALGITENKPLHDWSSHGADAFRYAGVTYRDEPSPWETDITETNRRPGRVKMQGSLL